MSAWSTVQKKAVAASDRHCLLRAEVQVTGLFMTLLPKSLASTHGPL